ncbi:pilus assembly protein [uncultured Cohaesibacter sp.]|uniref:TadE/TadG family type IV pilus assembly protein n=1 Tax=uncultured Cohaesibacter sp. TaxID=1002546 RepID=UPI0029C85E52|nr:pilus assembly protein [uncultured Cohaesibacter sp.]
MPAITNLRRALNKAFMSLADRSSSKARSFCRDESGAIAITFAVALIPILIMIGAAVDYSRIALNRSEAQDALDAATLAAVKKAENLTDDEVRTLVEDFVNANLPDTVKINIDLVEISRNPSNLKVWASGETKTTFMRIAGIDTSEFEATSSAIAGDKTVEIALVLDNSGSMAGSRITALKEAANSLVDILEESTADAEDLSIGIVPFNHLVRIDEGSQDASWLDWDTKSSVHRNNLPTSSNRFELFETLIDPYTKKAEEWEGCMEARMHPYDIKDTAPSSSYKDSYFLPYFYPDTHEDFNNEYNSYNNYLDCDSSSSKKGKKGSSNQSSCNSSDDGSLWYQYGEYYEQTFTKGYGPNYSCYVNRILPLTSNMTTVRSNINNLGASGNTNIHLGTIWGLRVLSPQQPYTEGREYSDDENLKFLIIMSDGANTYGSAYQAYGWADDGRIDGSSSTVREMNTRTLEACEAAKDDGVHVYTIAYGNLDSSTTEMMEDCATSEDNAYTPQNTSDMVQVFKDIAEALTTIRLTE